MSETNNFQFEIPQEEKWVKQVFSATDDEINDFLIEISDNPNKYRSPQVLGFNSAGKILLMFEEKLYESTESA